MQGSADDGGPHDAPTLENLARLINVICYTTEGEITFLKGM